MARSKGRSKPGRGKPHKGRGRSKAKAYKRKTKPHKPSMKRFCDNQKIRYAINTLSGYVYSTRTDAPRAKQAIEFLSSCDLSRNYGKRGGVTRLNASSALRMFAEYERKTGRRLKRLGGFDRKTLELVKRGFGLRAIEKGVTS